MQTAVPPAPPGTDATPESFWGIPADDPSHLERLAQTLPPLPEAPPAPEPAPEPAAVADAATIQRLESAIANLQASHGAQPAAVMADPTQLANALVQAMGIAADQRNSAAATAAALERPTLMIDDPEALISDPNVLMGAIRTLEQQYAGYAENLARFSEQRLLNRLGPAVDRAEAIGRVAGPMLQREMQRAEGEAIAIGVRSNIPEARFRELLPQARQIIDSATNLSPEQKLHMRMDPSALALAVQNVIFASGVPITQPSAAPPSAPLPSSGGPSAPAVKSRSRQMVETMLGKPLDWNRLETERGHAIDKGREIR